MALAPTGALGDGGALPSALVALGTNADITTLFNVATFGPQPLWILMIAAGCGVGRPIADAVMKPWWPLIAFSLVHVAIVVISATQADGVAPIAEFNEVFDATGFPFSPAPQQAMYHAARKIKSPTRLQSARIRHKLFGCASRTR